MCEHVHVCVCGCLCVYMYMCVCVYALRIVTKDKILRFINSSMIIIINIEQSGRTKSKNGLY